MSAKSCLNAHLLADEDRFAILGAWHTSRGMGAQRPTIDIDQATGSREEKPRIVSFSNANDLATTLHVPDDASPGQTIQLVLQATDGGKPPLTRYRRVVVSVK